MQVWIGTSGYSYPDWVGGFYPPGTKPKGMLAHYCHHFPVVELNFTYYRAPTAAMLENIAKQTPPGFQFLIKVPGTVTHDLSDQDLDTFRGAAEAIQRRGQLLGLLAQLPQRFHCERKNLAWLDHVAKELGHLDLGVEFRHSSWARPEVPEWLAERNVDLVSVDVPDVKAIYPRGLVQSNRHIYVRFHSRNAKNWYAEGGQRYDFNYPDSILETWVGDLREAAPRADRAVLMFNNCHRSQAADNAHRIRQMILERGPELEVVAPFATGETKAVQRSLFD